MDLHKWKVKLKQVRTLLSSMFKSGVLRVTEEYFSYLVLRICVSIQELEETYWVSVPHHNQVPSPISQVSRGRKTQRTFGT